jgi:hypothetical protein
MTDVGHEGLVPIYRGGETMALFDKMTFLVGNSNINVLESDEITKVFTDPVNYFVSPTFFALGVGNQNKKSPVVNWRNAGLQ